MNTKDIEKREELCRLLNMNFDEADELFSDETMQSMQMAQVNGGVVWVPVVIAGTKWLCAVIGTTEAGIAIYEFLKGDDKTDQGSVSPGPTMPFFNSTAFIQTLLGSPSDSVKVEFKPDGTMIGVVYGNKPKQ